MPLYYRVCKTDLKVLSVCVFLCFSIFVSHDPLKSKMYCNFHQLEMRTKLVSYSTSSTIKRINHLLLLSFCRFDQFGHPGSTENSCFFFKVSSIWENCQFGLQYVLLWTKMLQMLVSRDFCDPPQPWTLYCLYTGCPSD